MKILAVADNEEKALWDYYDKDRLGQIDLIISCGDIDPRYLDFLVSMTNADLLYVRGNHDEIYDRIPPPGGICIDGKVYDYHGLRVMGLGGCQRYKEGRDMYTERKMSSRIHRLVPKADLMNGIDLLVTHAPVRGYGDLDDLPHRGFQCFDSVLNRYRPLYMLHGHVHKEYGHFLRERAHPSGTKILNVCGFYVLEIGKEQYPERGKTGSFLYDLAMSLGRKGN